MTLTAHYQQFLSSPTADALAEGAMLSYVPTLTTIHETPAILKHFTAQAKQVKKEGEKVLNSIESNDGLCLDIDTTLKFVTGGGAYLPGLDDNFIADRVVIFPMIHIVHFDGNGKIQSIRQHWDQGSLLRQIEVIGARGRNWPIRDGKDQSKLISSLSSASSEPSAMASSRRSTTSSRDPNEVRVTSRGSAKDPHESLSLFGSREELERTPPSSSNVSLRMSAKPPPRDYNELFVGEANQPQSPSAQAASRAKKGAGKNFQPNRLFGGEEDAPPPRSPERSAIKPNSSNYDHFEFGYGDDTSTPTATPESTVKTNPKKYDHFEFGNGEDAATPKAPSEITKARSVKHNSQWDFDDFSTPSKTAAEKVKPRSEKHGASWTFEDFASPEKKPQPQPTKVHRQDVRHIGWSDDEVEPTPVKRQVKHQERPDARPHFDFADDGTPQASKKLAGTGAGRAHNDGLGLYRDHVTGAGNDEPTPEAAKRPPQQPLRTTSTNVSNEHRRKDFASHWDVADDHDPSAAAAPPNGRGDAPTTAAADAKPALSAANKRVLKGLDASWEMNDDAPDAGAGDARKENAPGGARRQGGDGMGGRAGTTRSWGFGDDSDEESQAAPVAWKRSARTDQPAQSTEKSWWDF